MKAIGSMKHSICQHNKLGPWNPSWNVFLCTPSLLLFVWSTVNTIMCTGSTLLSITLCSLFAPWVPGCTELCVFSWVRREQGILRLEIAAAVFIVYTVYCCSTDESKAQIQCQVSTTTFCNPLCTYKLFHFSPNLPKTMLILETH